MKTLAVLLALALLGGCASTTPRWDAAVGSSLRAALDAQVADRAAAARAHGPERLDGQAARRAQERYEQSFTEQPASTSLLQGMTK